jgi:hypothetical protein
MPPPLPWFLEVALIAAICGLWGTLRHKPPKARRAQLALTTLLALLLISEIRLTATPVARGPQTVRWRGSVHVPLGLGVADGGSSGCFRQAMPGRFCI